VTELDPNAVPDAIEAWLAASRSTSADADRLLLAALDREKTLRTVWLVLAVLTRALPTEPEVRRAHRVLVRDGANDAFGSAVETARAALRRGHRVELLRSAVVVDVRHTAETDLATGIQRVARETVKRWDHARDLTLVTWTHDGRSMRRLVADERATALHGVQPTHRSPARADKSIVVPVDGHYILPELAAEVWRTERVAAMAEFSYTRTSVIGFDCVPLTTAETVGDGMPTAFARNLGAVAKMDRLGAISEASATEYSGWRRMLAGSGLAGPDITSVLLAAEPGRPSEEDRSEFAELIGLGPSPLVLVVGSHEPRKNHMAVLQAAELAWREGLDFQLVFVGGNAWNSLDFSDALERLQQVGRPAKALSAVPDRLLWAGYSLARFSVFASINEGFGLPVAESLALGTPVLTSNYGSMEQIAATGGAVVVDPRNDYAILDGIRTLLSDNAGYAALRAGAARYPVRTWDSYAEELWQYFLAPY
jgi:Glycosyl transferases group 1